MSCRLPPNDLPAALADFLLPRSSDWEAPMETEAVPGIVIPDSSEVDVMGNVVGTKRGAGKRKVMIAAHMDEIGFMVKHIDDKGFIRLQPLGGFDPRQLFAQRVMVHGRDGSVFRGVLSYSTKPSHLLTPEEQKETTRIEKFFVDLGLGEEDVRKSIRVGDMVTMDRTLEECGRCVVSKSIDNRVGVFVMLEALKKLKSHEVDIYPVATVQEEIGLRGATTSAFSVDPDIGVALDTTICADYPGQSGPDMVTQLGKGVGIKIMDSSQICHPALVDYCRDLAEEHNITHQMEVLPRGGTDGGAIQRTRGGIASITLSVPTRYIHTVNEMASIQDIENTIDLLVRFLENAHTRDYKLP